MKILTLLMFTTLMSLTYGQFECEWPTLKTIDILEQPTVPGFLNDYSAPGQIQWNQQVNWDLNQLNALKENLFEETRSYHQERITFDPFREIETPKCDYNIGTSEPYWFQTERHKKKILFDF